MAAVGRVTVDGKDLLAFARIYCKRWLCDYCGPRKAAWLRQKITEKAKEHELTRFLTLTVDPKTAPEGEAVKYVKDVWRKFRVYLKREFGRTISFISVMELHKSGYPHLHVLVDQYIRQSWISEKWSRLGGGKVVWIEQVKDLRKIGWYLSKYLTKEMILEVPEGTRRYSCSRDIKLNDKEPSGWKLSSFNIDLLYKAANKNIVKEIKDKNDRVKTFIVENEIEELRPAYYDAIRAATISNKD